MTRKNLSEIYFVNKLDEDTFPPTFRIIDKYQFKYKGLVEKIKCAICHNKYLYWGGKVTHIICRSDIIFMPTIIQNYAVNWYHTYPLHPGMDSTKATMSQNYYWPNLRYKIWTYIKFCKTFQKNNDNNINIVIWCIFLVYLIGPYKIIK